MFEYFYDRYWKTHPSLLAGLILQNNDMCAVEWKKENPVEEHNCGFLPLIFPNFPIRMVIRVGR